MDYYGIGQRIRKYRKCNNFSQEELAERVGISVTHMSHIETGNTKLSLSVLVEISNVLDVGIDELIFPHKVNNKSKKLDNICIMLEECSSQQLSILSDIIKATIISMNKHL